MRGNVLAALLALSGGVGLVGGGCLPEREAGTTTPATRTAVAVGGAGLPAAKGPAETPFQATLRPYRVAQDLSNITNLKQHECFRKLAPEQRALLAKNAFVVAPADGEQLFLAYEANMYEEPKVPSFVTTDAVLQIYHVFYDYTLRAVEKEALYPAACELTSQLLQRSASALAAASTEAAKAGAFRNAAYLEVAAELLGAGPADRTLPGEVGRLAQAELGLISAHEGRAQSPIFGFKLDYSQFVPRGHYTRSEELKRYFMGMMWYGTVPFPYALKPKDRIPESTLRPAALQGAMLCALMGPKDGELWKLWDRIYEPTTFYVGSADDLTLREMYPVMEDVYGPPETWQPDALADEAKLDQLITRVNTELPQPQITTKDWGSFGVPVAQQLRLMGQRFIADSYILQHLVFDYVGTVAQPREFPRGLDVFAVLGNERALDLLLNTYQEGGFENYASQVQKLRAEFAEVPADQWTANLYWSWLWVLQAITEPKGNGFPSFMTCPAWQDKALNTALASWAELRHDTILYGKQSAVAEAGGVEPPRPPKGYVEPDVRAYRRLLELTRMSRNGLDARNLLSDELRQRFDELADLLSFLEKTSVKELRGEELTDNEYDRIQYLGGELERMTLSVVESESGQPLDRWHSLMREADRNLAVVADVHTGRTAVLEEAVGPAYLIYVVCPVEGKLVLTRGATFSYFEFLQPMSDRLSDEKWQAMLKEGNAPERPEWTASFVR